MFIPINALKAVNIAASKEATRFYLNGVFIEPHSKTGVIMTATNGQILISCYHDTRETESFSPVIIPSETIKNMKAPKGISDVETIITDNKIVFDIASTRIRCDAVDGSFPDFRRVVPRETDGNMAHYDYKLCVDLMKAKEIYTGSKSPIAIAFNGSGPALVDMGTPNMFGVIMPYSIKPESTTPPDWF